jgi:O-antigen ligase
MSVNLNWQNHKPHNIAVSASNLMAFSLFGSIFIQPKPAMLNMALCLMLLAISLIARPVLRKLTKVNISELRLVWISMLVWPLMTAILMLIQPHPIPLQSIGNPIRALLALGVLAYLTAYPARLEFLVAGIAIACLASFAHGLYDIYITHYVRALGWFNNENHFGNYSALAGLLAIISGFLATGYSAKIRFVFLSLGAMALWAAAASGTRTSSVIMVCLAPLFFQKLQDRTARLLRGFIVMGLVLVLGLAILSPKVQEFTRLREAVTDFERIKNASGGSSIGDRWQMWRASINMFNSSPVLGIGLANYEKELVLQIEKKQIRPLLTSQNQAHSQPLHSLATGGIGLMLAYLVFLIGPLLWFFRIYKRVQNNWQTRYLSYLGMSTVVAHGIFSLTVAIFDVQVFSSLYVISVCCLAGMAYQQEQHNRYSI